MPSNVDAILINKDSIGFCTLGQYFSGKFTNNKLDVIAIAFISVPESSRLETLTKTELSLAFVVE